MPLSDQGVTDNRYTLIPRMAIFLRRGDSYLLLKGAPTKRLWANKYDGLGGHVEVHFCYNAFAQGATMKKTFTAFVEFDEETGMYVGIIPNVPGAHTQAETLDELQDNLQEVLELCLEENPSL